MPPKEIRNQGPEPDAEELARAFQITRYAHASAKSLLAGFNSLGQARGGGAPSHEQQDLLRAMLLFAGAGLDACAQQVVRDSLPRVVQINQEARQALTRFGAKRLRKDSRTDVGGVDTELLTSLLIGDAEEGLIEVLIEELTGSSMQSVEELKRVAAHLGVVQTKPLLTAIEAVREPLQVRNRIAHDMDVKFTESTSRNRKGRKRADMVKDANLLLACSENLISAVDSALK